VPRVPALDRRRARVADGCGAVWGTLVDVSSPVIQAPKLLSLAHVPHAIPYQGSKRGLAHAIIPLIPAGVTELIEPFAGSAAIAIAAKYAGVVESVHINDINKPLMKLWSQIVANPTGIADDYERLWVEQLSDPRAYYDTVRDKFNDSGEPHYLLYLLARCVKAAVRYSRGGSFNQSADHRRLGAKPLAMRQRIARASSTLASATISSVDYVDLLMNASKGSVVYMDPPYQGVTNTRDHRYMRGIERNEFESVLREAVFRDVSFILSYDAVTETNKYGAALDRAIGLTHLHIAAGRSSQATLQGLDHTTVESLYLSPSLVHRLDGELAVISRLSEASGGTGVVAARPSRVL
jgi:DNA adenine methylase